MEGFDHGWPYWPKETMRLRPHGFTILVEPDPAPEKTDSGRIVLPEDVDYVPTSGTVVAVGKGSKRLWEERQRAHRRVFAVIEGALLQSPQEAIRIRDEANALMNQPEPTPSVVIGERVVFAAEAGLIVKDEDGTSYILLEEDRVAIIVEEESEVA